MKWLENILIRMVDEATQNPEAVKDDDSKRYFVQQYMDLIKRTLDARNDFKKEG